MPNTKIVATLGPASDSPSAIRQLLLAGVDVFRLNASHSTQAQHAVRIAATRAAADRIGAQRLYPAGSARPKDPARPLRGRRLHARNG